MHTSKPAELVHLGTDRHKRGLMACMPALPYIVWHLELQKSSANYLGPRVFAQKGFVDLIFGHFFCPFSQNFFDSCAKRIEKITNLFYKNCYK
jgi:hypothetical protein